MLFKRLTSVLAVVSCVSAQRPSNVSICDYYTIALLKNNTAQNQYTLLTLLVNTVVIGNCKILYPPRHEATKRASANSLDNKSDTAPNVGVAVPGILAAGTFNGTNVNLKPYFTGTLASTNTGGKTGQSVNFLDGGGAAPLQKNSPANDEKSNQ